MIFRRSSLRCAWKRSTGYNSPMTFGIFEIVYGSVTGAATTELLGLRSPRLICVARELKTRNDSVTTESNLAG